MRLLSTKGKGAQATAALLARLSSHGASSGASSGEAAYERAISKAQSIVSAVRRGGDRALLRYRAKFDGVAATAPLRVSPEQMEAAWRELSAERKAAYRQAAKNIRRFAERQRPRDFMLAVAPGVVAGQRVVPLASVGCYVPSGRYPLPSTLLMTAIPAQVAGVARIVAVSPRPVTETLAAAYMLGIEEFYAIGGAQAVAALAYGTESLPRVDKIVGPGNAYVTAAKKLVSFDCGIDMLAGPTEIAVVSERDPAEPGVVAGIATDLIAQAEHDADAVSLLFTSRMDLARAVLAEVREQVRGNAVAKESLAKNGSIVVTKSAEEARALANQVAPEHLTVDGEEDLAWVRHAGSVFVGPWSAQSLGDYVTGPNHTLPTSGLARLRGGLSVVDYVKLITVQQYTAQGVEAIGPAAVLLADSEGLKGHAASVRLRLEMASQQAGRTSKRKSASQESEGTVRQKPTRPQSVKPQSAKQQSAKQQLAKQQPTQRRRK